MSDRKERGFEIAFAVALTSALALAGGAPAFAQANYQVVADFNGTLLAQPNGGVIKGPDGALYGTTRASDLGCGGIYRVGTNGAVTVLHYFTRNVDGCAPFGELTVGTDGNLYGTASEGGPTTVPLTQGRGTGTIYRITTTGQFTLLYEFPFDTTRGIAPEGMMPFGALALAGDGNFYGLTNFSGDPGPCGTVFRISHAGVFSVVHHLANTTATGCYPNSGLSVGVDGHLYGVTINPGYVFRVTTSGTFTPLANFPVVPACNNCSPFGSTPLGEPVQDAAGNLYGTTQTGGPETDPNKRFGTIWKLSPTGQFTLLHAFNGTDGRGTSSGLTMGSDGNLYGASYGDGGFSTVFRITPSGVFTALHTFTQSVGTDGRLLEFSPGVFIGTTQGGGSGGRGLIFSVSVASPTTTALAASTSSSVYGQPITFTATVSSTSGSPTGQVEFFDGSALIGIGVINNGEATLSTGALGLGTHAISASYAGDGTFLPSASNSVSVTVNRAQSTLSMAAVPEPSQRRDQVTLTVTAGAASPGAGTPTGVIQLFEGRKQLGTATLQGGVATFQLSLKSPGGHVLRAAYAGDANFLGSERTYTHTVAR